MSYAFARDGGLPGSFWLYHLNEKKLPIRALLVIILLDAILIVPSLVSASLFSAINSIGTVGKFLNLLFYESYFNGTSLTKCQARISRIAYPSFFDFFRETNSFLGHSIWDDSIFP